MNTDCGSYCDMSLSYLSSYIFYCNNRDYHMVIGGGHGQWMFSYVPICIEIYRMDLMDFLLNQSNFPFTTSVDFYTNRNIRKHPLSMHPTPEKPYNRYSCNKIYMKISMCKKALVQNPGTPR